MKIEILDIKLGPRLKQEIRDRIKSASNVLSDPIPGILLGRHGDEEERITMGEYEKETVLRETQIFQIYDIDGIEAVMPQEQLRNSLKSKKLN